MSTPLTNEDIAMLEAVKSADEWNAACSKLKAARGGVYPSDWWPKVKLSGMMERILSSFGETSELSIVTGQAALEGYVKGDNGR